MKTTVVFERSVIVMDLHTSRFYFLSAGVIIEKDGIGNWLLTASSF